LIPWWKSVVPFPTSNNPVHLYKDGPPEHMVNVGFIPRSSTIKNVPWREVQNPHWIDYSIENKIIYDDNAYHIANPTHASVYRAALKFDLPDMCPLDHDVLSLAFGDLLSGFEPLKDKCRIKSLGDVVYTPAATAGVVENLVFDCPKKFDVVTELLWYVQLFWETAHLVDHSTLLEAFRKS